MESHIKKDFYHLIPKEYAVILDKYEKEYCDESWFYKAWVEYRFYVIHTPLQKLKEPIYVFGRFIKQ